MPDAKFSLFAINVPDYLIMRARETTAPGAEVGNRAVLGPNPTGTLNFLVTDLRPVNHYLDLYESVDGVTLSNLLGTFTWDVKTLQVTEELRYYVVDSSVNNSPVDGTNSFTDDYLTGKTVSSFEKRSIGPLVPDGQGLGVEWSIAGAVITLGVDMPAFTSQETYVARITYATIVDTPINTGFFKGVKTITADTLLDITYRNCRIKCNGLTDRLVATMEDITSIPNGTFWYFMDQNGGAQLQTKIALTSGNILFNGANFPETWIGKADCIWIEFNDGIFEIIQPSDVLRNVGKHSSETGVNFANLYPEDFSLYSADDLPAIYYWLLHSFPSANYIVFDDNVDNPAYVGDPARPGLFTVSTTKRMFRFPNTQGLSEKGSKSFTTFGADPDRLYDYPGGKANQKGMDHAHDTHGGAPITGTAGNLWLSCSTNPPNPNAKRYTQGGTSDNFGGNNVSGGPDHSMRTGPMRANTDAYTLVGSTENTVNNFSVIYYRHV